MPMLVADQNVVVILDDSGSMDDRMRTKDGRVKKIKAAKSALVGVLNQLPPDTNVGVLTLNSQLDGTNWIIPIDSAMESGERSQRIQQIRAVGSTPLGQFMKIGADELLNTRDSKVYGVYRLLIVTDGEANDSQLVDSALPDILSRGLTVDVIGVDMKSDHSLATRVHSYRRADDNDALAQALSEVFGETSANDQDAAADFEILAALPEGFAEQALEALSSKGNTPISESTLDATSEGASFNGSRSAGSAIFGLLCCVGPPFLVVIVIIVVATNMSKQRRR